MRIRVSTHRRQIVLVRVSLSCTICCAQVLVRLCPRTSNNLLTPLAYAHEGAKPLPPSLAGPGEKSQKTTT